MRVTSADDVEKTELREDNYNSQVLITELATLNTLVLLNQMLLDKTKFVILQDNLERINMKNL